MSGTVVQRLTDIDAAEVTDDLLDQAKVANRGFGHAPRQRDDPAPLQPEAFDIGQCAVFGKADRDQFPLSTLGAR